MNTIHSLIGTSSGTEREASPSPSQDDATASRRSPASSSPTMTKDKNAIPPSTATATATATATTAPDPHQPHFFIERLEEVLGENGYLPAARRSVQTAVLFEAHRSLSEQLPKMRPFQRKLAVLDQAKALVHAAPIQPLRYKQEILWRTTSSKEIMDPQTVWKKLQTIRRELEKLRTSMETFCEEGKPHHQIVQDYLQKQYEETTNRKGEKVKEGWEHAHSHFLLTYRMYYKGSKLDPDLPPPAPIAPVVVPLKKPPEFMSKEQQKSQQQQQHQQQQQQQEQLTLLPKPNSGTPPTTIAAQTAPAYQVLVAEGSGYPMPPEMPGTSGNANSNTSNTNKSRKSMPLPTVSGTTGTATTTLTPAAELTGPVTEDDIRRARLEEVRSHLELLKDFEGVIDAEELMERKRQLFYALPDAPPAPTDTKRPRTSLN